MRRILDAELLITSCLFETQWSRTCQKWLIFSSSEKYTHSGLLSLKNYFRHKMRTPEPLPWNWTGILLQSKQSIRNSNQDMKKQECDKMLSLATDISTIPTELLLPIFSYLDSIRDIYHLTTMCKSFRLEISNAPQLVVKTAVFEGGRSLWVFLSIQIIVSIVVCVTNSHFSTYQFLFHLLL